MKLSLFITLLAVEMCLSYRLVGEKGTITFSDEYEDEKPKKTSSETKEPVLVFESNWEEEVKGKLAVGKNFTIIYNGARLPGRPTMYGQPAWKIYAEFKFSETGEVHSVGLDGPKMVEDQEILHKSIFMPYDAKKLIIWFKLWTYSGPDKYDSDYGKNYHFDITEPSIVFDKDWEETVHGSLKAGEMFDVYYDSKRLDEDKEIYLQAKFCEDCDVMTEMLLEVGSDTTYLTEVVPIPKDAKKVIMWFYHEVDGEKKYDSDYSKNYHFELASD